MNKPFIASNTNMSLRQYINSLSPNPFPRQGTINDEFFSRKIRDVLQMTPQQLSNQLGYVVGMGTVSRQRFLIILEDLRHVYAEALQDDEG